MRNSSRCTRIDVGRKRSGIPATAEEDRLDLEVLQTPPGVRPRPRRTPRMVRQHSVFASDSDVAVATKEVPRRVYHRIDVERLVLF